MSRLLGLALLVALAGVPVPAGASGVGTSPSSIGVEHVLFKGGTGGYGCYRIPALVRTGADTLLAFAEARESPSCADREDIDIVVRRSTNDGRTWGPQRVVLSGIPTDADKPFTRGNPAPVVDVTTGRVFLLSTSNEAVPGGARLPWVQHSDDDGVTWSAARQIPASFDGTTRGWFATGPSHGIQLRNGRLVVGAHQAVGNVVQSGVLYSPDHGENWFASETPDSYVEGKIRPGEMSVAELPNGDVYVAGRNEITTGHHRTMATAISTDSGMTVSTSTPIPTLTTPNVQGAVLALRNGTMLFSGPSDPTDRELMRIRYSTDNGVTWIAGGLINGSKAGYSDLAELATGEIGLLYEGGTNFSADEIRFNRFTTQQAQIPGGTNPTAEATPTAGPTSPDTTVEANDAYVRGSVNAGLTGQADVPYARSLDVGAQDFTIETSFRHGGSTANQALFWAYGLGAGAPQVWARIQQGQLTAWVRGTTGGANVTLNNAYADNAWHRLSLSRTGNRITLTVDGVSATATGVTGAVTKTRTGLRLGSRLDGADAFSGNLKDFTLREAGVEVVNLPFTTVDGAAAPTRVSSPITDDLSGHCGAGSLLGGYRGTVVGRGERGAALDIDSTHPGVEVPYTPALDAGAQDFAFSLWFKYQAGTANHALLWAYGATAGKPSVWVRAQPGNDRLYGWVETDLGQVAVALTDSSSARAFGDGAWHQMSLKRIGGRVELSVDGGTPAVTTGLTGSVSNNLGVRVGSKPDGTDVLDGSLDDVQLTVGGQRVLWWGFEHQNTQAHDVVRTPLGPATADTSVYCHHSAVRGGAATTAGVTGRALAFDGVDDDVVIPYQRLDGDFAIDFRMRYTAGTADQVLVWAYGVGGTERALWLRAQPSRDRLFGMVRTDAGPTSIAAAGADAFGDGLWHQVVLRRTGDVLELLVDGTVRGSAVVKGSLTYGDTFAVDGLRLGAKPDGADRFKGTLDEFRVQRGGATITHLPFEVVSPTPYARG